MGRLSRTECTYLPTSPEVFRSVPSHCPYFGPWNVYTCRRAEQAVCRDLCSNWKRPLWMVEVLHRVNCAKHMAT